MSETEEEQIEALKKWWDENGRAIIVGVVFGAAAIFGWRFWEAQQLQHAQSASSAYQQIMVHYNQGDAEQLNAAALALRDEYTDTPYSSLAALLQAKMAIDADKLAEASEALRWVSDNSPEEDVRTIARLRLARALSAQGEHDAAIQAINTPLPDAYSALAEETRGDILLAQGNADLARQAYARALAENQSTGSSALLQMKFDDLAPAADES